MSGGSESRIEASSSIAGVAAGPHPQPTMIGTGLEGRLLVLTTVRSPKISNNEFCLTFEPELGWHAEIGNRLSAVGIGEAGGDVSSGYKPTVTEALDALLLALSEPPVNMG